MGLDAHVRVGVAVPLLVHDTIRIAQGRCDFYTVDVVREGRCGAAPSLVACGWSNCTPSNNCVGTNRNVRYSCMPHGNGSFSHFRETPTFHGLSPKSFHLRLARQCRAPFST